MLTTNSSPQLSETSFRQVQSFDLVAGKEWSIYRYVNYEFSVDVDAGFSQNPSGRVIERFPLRVGDKGEIFFRHRDSFVPRAG